jgi:hypothetical protein
VSDFRTKRFIFTRHEVSTILTLGILAFWESRYVAGLIHPDVSKGTVSMLSLLRICVWHFIYCTASSFDVHGFGWCLFQTHSHLLHGLPTILHPIDLYLTTRFGMLPSAWCDYDWPFSYVVISVILTEKKNSSRISSLLILSYVPQIFLENCGFCCLIFYIQYQECHQEQTPTSERGKQKPQHNNNNAK